MSAVPFLSRRFAAQCLALLSLVGSLGAGSAHAQAAAEGGDGLEHDAVLDALIGAAWDRNPLLRAKRSEVSAAGLDVDAARWQYAPSLSMLLQRASGPVGQYGSTVRVDQRLYTGGRLDAELATAASRRDAGQLAVHETAVQLAQQVVSAYQALQIAQARQRAIDAYRERLTQLDQTIDRRVDAGVSPVSERALMNARTAQATNDFSGARAAAETALATLARLTGQGAVPSVATPVMAGVTPPPTLCRNDDIGARVRQEALDHHPALRRSRQDEESARLTVEGQRAALLPTLTLRVDQPVGPTQTGTPSSGRIGLVFEYTTGQGLSASKRVDASRERLSGLKEQSLAVRMELEQQIRAECVDQDNATRLVGGLAQARSYSGEVLASYTRLFLAGKRAWMDVLNAAREDFDNEQAALIAAVQLRGARYRLALLAGDYDPGPAVAATERETR